MQTHDRSIVRSKPSLRRPGKLLSEEWYREGPTHWTAPPVHKCCAHAPGSWQGAQTPSWGRVEDALWARASRTARPERRRHQRLRQRRPGAIYRVNRGGTLELFAAVGMCQASVVRFSAASAAGGTNYTRTHTRTRARVALPPAPPPPPRLLPDGAPRRAQQRKGQWGSYCSYWLESLAARAQRNGAGLRTQSRAPDKERYHWHDEPPSPQGSDRTARQRFVSPTNQYRHAFSRHAKG